MAITTAKKENEKKKAKTKQEKAQKMLDRKLNAKKGKSLEEMMAYVDENGNLTSTPPGTAPRKKIKVEDILIGARPVEEEAKERTGSIAFFNDNKGYGFITDDQTKENVFVHSKNLLQTVKEKDRVSFEKEKSDRGYNAIKVKKI